MEWDEFLAAGEAVVGLFAGDEPGSVRWKWSHGKLSSARGNRYLSGEAYVRVPFFSPTDMCAELDVGLCGEEEEEDAEVHAAPTESVENDTSRRVLFFLYHIVWSSTYRAPVLYFNVTTMAGRPLAYDEVWQVIPATYKVGEHLPSASPDKLPLTTTGDHWQHEDTRWSFISQGEHPLLGTPFFFIHPCETAALLGQFNSSFRPHPTLGNGHEPAAPESAVDVCDARGSVSSANLLLSWLSVSGPVVHIRIPLGWFDDAEMCPGRCCGESAVAT